jgi:hypothetical protein
VEQDRSRDRPEQPVVLRYVGKLEVIGSNEAADWANKGRLHYK